MKNIMLFIAVLALLTNCTVTKPTISPQKLGLETGKTINDIKEYGYTLVGTDNDTQTELVSAGASYTYYSGYTNLLANKSRGFNNYTFKGETGNVVFGVSFTARTDSKSMLDVHDIIITKCYCDDQSHFDAICGYNGFVRRIATIQPDQTSDFYSPGHTYALLSSMGVILLFLMLL